MQTLPTPCLTGSSDTRATPRQLWSLLEGSPQWEPRGCSTRSLFYFGSSPYSPVSAAQQAGCPTQRRKRQHAHDSFTAKMGPRARRAGLSCTHLCPTEPEPKENRKPYSLPESRKPNWSLYASSFYFHPVLEPVFQPPRKQKNPGPGVGRAHTGLFPTEG